MTANSIQVDSEVLNNTIRRLEAENGKPLIFGNDAASKKTYIYVDLSHYNEECKEVSTLIKCACTFRKAVLT
ncbi:MAG: hypothetical protein HC849_31045 [Oscillatoriales cyanobacterium RU_3_3]|nr:hypothetical protein [Oscillatoriales cyanobacterium RU_3_3]